MATTQTPAAAKQPRAAVAARASKAKNKTPADVAAIAKAMEQAAPAQAVTAAPAGAGAVAIVIDPSAGSTKALEPHVVGEEVAVPTVGKGAKARKEAEQAPSPVLVTKADGAAPVLTPVAAAKGKRASKGKAADKAPALPLPGVFADEHKHTCIAVAEGRKYVQLIPMDAGGIAVTKLSKDQFAKRFETHMKDYNVGKAAKQYLAGTMVVTPQAKAMLELLAKAEADKPIASGVLVALMSKGDEKADPDAAVPETIADSTKPAKQAKAPKEPKAPKAPGAPKKAWEHTGKTIAKGKEDYAANTRPGTLRAALMECIVKAAGKPAESVLGAVVMAGKTPLAKVDVEFALAKGYITLK